MHLLATQSGVVDGNAEAVDLDQTPGDIIFVSAADSELASLARAVDSSTTGLSVRLANQMALSHNLSIDTWIEKTAAQAKLIIARVLGGKAYWGYGVDQLCATARANGCKLVLLPGGTEPDTDLTDLSTINLEACERIRQYIAHGGKENAVALLDYCDHLLTGTPPPPPPNQLAKAGIYGTYANPQNLPIVAITFYRALIEGGLTAPVDALAGALAKHGVAPLPVYLTSLKDADCTSELNTIFSHAAPDLILNATGFATGKNNPLAVYDCPVLQTVFSGTSRKAWQDNPTGLPARDLAMNIVLPELDGRIMTRAVSFKADHHFHEKTQCRIISYEPLANRIDFTAQLAANWTRLRKTQPKNRKLAIILANYPNRDGRIGNGVGYDTPASTINILNALADAGYESGTISATGNALIERLQQGPTNSPRNTLTKSPANLSLTQYLKYFAQLPDLIQKQVTDRWGNPEQDPFVAGNNFHLPVILCGNIAVGIQPARGYNIDPTETYHDPALVPPHGYLAFYLWLREHFQTQAIIHNGKHGNLEWLPGKSVGLSHTCFPEIAMGAIPQLYPFIVNDPGEGTQAKRRTSAVIIDHLTPPLTRAETYGPYRDLEVLIDEYYLASGLDQRRLDSLRRQILDLTQTSGLDEDAGIVATTDEDQKLQQLDTYLCELKEAQIRDGLHIFGQSPQNEQETDLLVALTRTPRGLGDGADASLIKALAQDFGLHGFDPFDCVAGQPWRGPKPKQLLNLTPQPWRTNGDTVERLEMMATKLVASMPPSSLSEGKSHLNQISPFFVIPAKAGIQENQPHPVDTQLDSGFRGNDGSSALDSSNAMPVPQGQGELHLPAASKVLNAINTSIRPTLAACGVNEIANLLSGLNGNFVPPGPSGAPTRGRLDVLPTGKNFYSLDNRTIPTPTAWTLGEKSAANMLTRHFQDYGHYPATMGLSVWGTSNMRTGGDDIAQALALIGVKPKWDTTSWRVTGFEIIPVAKLGRPRVDVTLRISGFFRDAFPAQIELFDKAARAVGSLDEAEQDNPLAARMKRETAELIDTGLDQTEAERLAGFRVFGSKPGAYGAGLQALIDEKLWANRADLASAYVTWGAYAYGAKASGEHDPETFTRRLKRIEAVIHNQDNREHDLLDSDDYYQFEGGMTAAVEETGGTRPLVYHNDHSRPEKPVTRTLEEEIGRVVRSRVVNPKWINGVMRHGYKGAFEIAATVDYMFAFAATTGAVKPHHFDLAYDAFINDEKVRQFINDNNPQALAEIADRLNEAISRNLWTPKSNSAYNELNRLMETSNDQKS